MKSNSTILVLLLVLLFLQASGQTGISFTTSTLTGVNVSNPTVLAFGPDNRLYVTQQDGFIYAYTVQKNGSNNYVVTNTELISTIRDIPNHNDRGGPFTGFVQRQVTGMVVTGTAANPVLYICSSDPRIGGGGELGDIDLDTNSGIISKLTKNGSTWSMVHVVKGLPRCEENHSPNGLLLDEVSNTLYVAQGGNTNAGSPSNNFGFLAEYALSAAILTIDLDQINSQFGGSYTLPTLDDPTRANLPDGTDVNDPWGGNDGLNQSKLVIGGPVQIYAPGFRLSFDLLITKTPGKAGRMYSIGNGGNVGWGGYPENEGTPNVTNNRLLSEPGSTAPTLTDAIVNNRDGLHFITGPGYYAGHPNPIRANPAGAGWYWFDNATGQGHFEQNPTVDWPPYPVSMANPIESDYRNPGVNDGSLYTWAHSTNGMAEYTSTAFFNGAMAGNLLAACWDGGIYRIQLNEAGNAVTQVTKMFTGFGDTPLDVIAQGDGQIFPGTIWSVVYGGNGVTIFEPVGTPTNCTGDNNNFSLDDDGDGYSNGDETVNGTDPCSAASKPNDFDLDFVSDMRDPDDDNDGLNDIQDKFALDANNGRSTQMPVDYPFLNGNPGFGLFGIGQTGVMTNYVNSYETQYDLEDPALIAGGAVGALSVPAQAGDATTNNQKYAFQFGIPVTQSTTTFTLQSRLLGSPFFNGATGANLGTQSVGIYFGNGDQDNYLKFVLHANNGNPGFQILCEQNGTVVNQQMIPVANILSTAQMDLFIEVNAVTGLVKCRYQNSSTPSPVQVGQDFTVSGNLLNLLLAHNDGVAVGVIASCGNKVPFSASWDFMKVTTSSALENVIRINAGGPAQNFGGEVWVADQNFTGGNVYSTAAAISNTTQDAIYQTERYGNFSYAIPVPAAGTYAVDLHLAEIYFTTSGSRIFNINIENGQFVRNNLDLIQTYGDLNEANVLRADNLNIIDGTINITFTSVVDNAKISGIAVSRYNTAPGNTPPVVSNPIPDQNATVGQAYNYVVAANTFSDPDAGTTLTYSASLSNGNPLPLWLSFNTTTRTFSGTPAVGDVAVLDIRVTASDGTAPANDTFTLNVSQPALTTFYRALNLNGAALTIDGNNWQSSTGAANFSFSQTGGGVFGVQNTVLIPATDANRSTMIRSSIWGNAVNVNVTAVPTGSYDVYLYVWEDNFTETYSVSLEGTVVLPVYNSGTGGTWAKLGPFRANINDGAINVSTNGGHSNVSGIEIWTSSSTPGNTPPVVSNPIPDQNATVGQAFSYVVPANTFSDPDAGTTLTYSASLSNNNPLPLWLSFNTTTRTFTGTPAVGDVAVLDIRVTASDGTAPANDTFTLNVSQPAFTTFYRALNLNGAALTIDGNSWQSSIGAANFSFTQVGGGVFGVQNTALIPATDANRSTMIRSSIWGNTVNINVTSVPNGSYDVYLYVWEDNFNVVYSISLEGAVVVPAHNSGTAGAWNKLGPFRANITDGAINVSTNGGHSNVSGIEIWTASSTPGNTPPVVTQPYPDQSIANTQTSLVMQLGQIFNDDGGVSNLTFTVSNNTNAALISNTQIVGSQLTFTLTGTTGSGMITLRATDANNQFVEDVFQLAVTDGTTPQLVNIIRINSGGPAQNFGGEAWVADQYFTGGNLYSTAAAISNTTQDQVYQTERYGNFSYAIPVPSAGTYAVDLHFAEIFFTTAGSRIFNVNIENGQFVRNNLDLIQTYGDINEANVLRADNLNITDGTINITFITVADNAKISGIAVGRYNTTPGNTPPVVSNPIPDQTATVGLAYNYVVPANTFSDPDAGTTLTYSASLSNGNPLPLWLSFNTTTRTFSGTPAAGDVAVLDIRVTASDGTAPANDTFTLNVSQPAFTTFYRALNLNGAALTIDGNNWQSSIGAANFNFTQTGGGVFGVQNVTLVPSTDANRSTMIRSSIWGNAVNINVTSVPTGTYDVYLYVWEDDFTQAYSISLEGTVVLPVYNSGPGGTWAKLGPFRANIIDGAINVSTNGQHANVSGIEIYSAGAGARAAVAGHAPIVKTPRDVTIYEGQSWNYQVEASDPDGDKLFYSTKNLPASLYIDKTTGFIKGTIEVSANTYPVTLKVSDPNGLSTDVRFTVTIASRPVLPEIHEQQFVVFPNPTDKNEFSVRLDAKQRDQWKFTLLDFTGRQIELGSFEFEKGIQEVTLDLAPYNLSAGVYYLSVQNSLGKKVIKVGIKL